MKVVLKIILITLFTLNLGSCFLQKSNGVARSQEIVNLLDQYGSFADIIHWGKQILQTNSINGFVVPEKEYPKGLADAGVLFVIVNLDTETGKPYLIYLFKTGLVYEALELVSDGARVPSHVVKHYITNDVYYVRSAH